MNSNQKKVNNRIEYVLKNVTVKKLTSLSELKNSHQWTDEAINFGFSSSGTTSSTTNDNHKQSNSKRHHDTAANEDGSQISNHIISFVKNNIIGSTEVFVKEKVDEEESISLSCPICIEDYEVGQSVCLSINDDCKHCFHLDCMMDWLIRHNDCPLCRAPFIPSQQGEVLPVTRRTRQQNNTMQSNRRQRIIDFTDRSIHSATSEQGYTRGIVAPGGYRFTDPGTAVTSRRMRFTDPGTVALPASDQTSTISNNNRANNGARTIRFTDSAASAPSSSEVSIPSGYIAQGGYRFTDSGRASGENNSFILRISHLHAPQVARNRQIHFTDSAAYIRPRETSAIPDGHIAPGGYRYTDPS